MRASREADVTPAGSERIALSWNGFRGAATDLVYRPPVG
jgi:hypothetical protein